MAEERKNSQDFVFVNRTAGITVSNPTTEKNEEENLNFSERSEPIKRETWHFQLKGEPFVLFFQAVFCILVLLIILLIKNYGGIAAERFANGYRQITEAGEWDFSAYFEPIAPESQGESQIESAESSNEESTSGTISEETSTSDVSAVSSEIESSVQDEGT